MNTGILIIEITIILVSLMLGFAIKNFLPSYFNEKGKNLATKEDIEIITEKVEKIKSEFVKDLEFIKTDLHYISQSKFNIKSAEREALIELNLRYSEWLNYLMNLSFSDINLGNYRKLDKYYEETKLKKNNFYNAESKLHLFLHDEELIEAKLNCVNETLKYELIIVQAIAEMSNQYNLMEIYFGNVAEKNPDIKWLKEQRVSAQKELDKIFFAMNDEKLKQFSVVHSKRVTLTKILRSKLFDIIT